MTVYLVGAGPGDPDLVTVRGARVLATADAVLCDRLARPLLGLVPARAEVVDVGKASGAARVSQEEINRLLVDYGRRLGCVVRLKGGDPFVFGRGAEEVAALVSAGVEFSVVPGVSAAIAAPAAAGVPLTSRGIARSFTVLTGHDDPGSWSDEHAAALGAVGGTIVVMMGAARLARIAARLVAAGMAPTTPVVSVRAATTAEQQVRRATLGALGDDVLGSPAVAVIGAAAGLDLRPGQRGARASARMRQ